MTKIITNHQTISELIDRRLDHIIPKKTQLIKLLSSGKRLTIYQGFDPSSPDLHIGHLVGLLTLKAFQQLGHEVIFLIGDFTGMIGDPTGKLQTRSILTEEQVTQNAQTYMDQAGMVLSFSGKNPVQLKRNSTWNKKLTFADVIQLSSHFTVQQMIERDMFQTRLDNQQEIFLNEFWYPLVQGYDSVAMEVDIEIGGSDQLFNMMAGRKLVKEKLNKEKFVLTTPLLTDSNGKKIGKTAGNAINLKNPPHEFYGQIMSLPDDAIYPCFQLITEVSSQTLQSIKQLITKDPMAAKKQLAWEITQMLHDTKTADTAQKHFENTVQAGDLPKNIPTIKQANPNQDIVSFITKHKLLSSKSATKRLIEQGGVSINNKKITDFNTQLKPDDILKIGKRKFVQIK